MQPSESGAVQPDESARKAARKSVFSGNRTVKVPSSSLPAEAALDTRIKMDGIKFLKQLEPKSIPVAFLDPQYRGVLDKMSYGNEGKSRSKRRSALQQMDPKTISRFLRGIDRALIPSGHLFLWVDKFHLCQGVQRWLAGTDLETVDLLTWDKGRMGLGYRTRRRVEYCLILQKAPRRAKGVWASHDIPDVLHERVSRGAHPHTKPVEIQARLLAAVSNEGDIVIDPAAGSFSVLEAANSRKRHFLGCDLNG